LKLESYLAGNRQSGSGNGESLVDPVTGEILATASSQGLNLMEALEYSRNVGNPALQALSYKQRAELLGKIADVLAANRAEYFEISRRNQGATEGDASFDVDGAVYTIKQYAKWGAQLDGNMLRDGAPIALSKTGAFQGQHFLKPLTGVAVFINAFNFPAWGLWEKASPSLLAGVPVFVKPATATAWLTQRMVKDVIDANILPAGALSVLCGSAGNLLDHVREDDVISFTGSAKTAAAIKSHANVIARSVRVNVEADSLNSAILGPDVAPGTPVFDLLVREVIKEMTQKAGQKCTAIRRILGSRDHAAALADALKSKLEPVKVGNPVNAEVKCGPLVSKSQQKSALAGLAELKSEARVIFGGGENFQPIDADASKSAFIQPTLLLCDDPTKCIRVHEVEVFGPVATIMPYGSADEVIDLARRGCGSLVASLFTDDPEFKQQVVLGIANSHGRIMVVDSTVDKQHTGHGNVMPNSLHGGPGRAGGGEELGGLRALMLYHRRFVVQGPPSLLEALSASATDIAKLYS
jgi:3,4-dehydroadipyl-CoA semialdehyde dehydrogenase